MSIQGPQDRSPLNRLQKAAGASPATPASAAGPASKASGPFSLRPASEAGAAGAAIPVAARGALVQRIRDRLAGGAAPEVVLREEVNREVTVFLGRADPRIVDKVTGDVRNDPSLSEIFGQLVRHATEGRADPAAGR